MRKKTALALAAASAGAAFAAGALRKDESFALLREGYDFIPNRSRRSGSDVFETRLMLAKAVCMTGEEAARVFYEPGRFTRRGALPHTTLKLLQDKGSVQQLDGEAHAHRKGMFMSLMTPESMARLVDVADEEWRAAAGRWEAAAGPVVLHDEAQEVLCRAVCRWAGVPLADAGEARQRTREFAAMINGAGDVVPQVLRGMALRPRTERWARGIVERVRAGELDAPEEGAAGVIARHRDPDGEPLDVGVAAVELINVLRPTVAVAKYVTFAALALHEHPGCRDGLLSGDGEYLGWFVQEIRRYYPFFPLVGGRVVSAFDWGGRRFDEGTWVLLDLYGTNHDPRIWDAPQEFRPERFRLWDGSAYNFVPQGGGDYGGHRCPGEWITIGLMRGAVRLLTESVSYEVPEQDLRVRLSRMPAVPESGFVISNVGRSKQTESAGVT